MARITDRSPPPAVPAELDEAVDAARRGEEDGIRALYRWMNPSLLRYLHFHAGAAGEDLASEVWVDVARTLAGFVGGARELRAFVFSVARRRLVDHYRRVGRTPDVVPIEAAADPPAAEDTAELGIEALMTRGAVAELVRCLSPEQAEIVLLRVLGDLDVEQVARLVGKSAGAVRVAQHRALQRMRHRLAGRSVTR